MSILLLFPSLNFSRDLLEIPNLNFLKASITRLGDLLILTHGKFLDSVPPTTFALWFLEISPIPSPRPVPRYVQAHGLQEQEKKEEETKATICSMGQIVGCSRLGCRTDLE
jgi:hypothetical protein